MESYKGKSVFKGIAVGTIRFYSQNEQFVKPIKIEDSALEWKRYENAMQTAKEQLKKLYDKAVLEVGEANAEIFQAHSIMLLDEDYNQFVKNMIVNEKINAEYAVSAAGKYFFERFACLEDEYFKARAVDIKDVSKRLMGNLNSYVNASNISQEPAIIVAEDLTPSETIQMDKKNLLAFVTKLGSANSHTAILARSMNIPALVGVEIKKEWDGKLAIIDGYSGGIVIEPDKKTLEIAFKKKEEELKKQELYKELKGKETITLSGRRIKLFANIGSVSELEAVLENDAEGIGLFRSEFLYLEKDTYPTEEEQFAAYQKVAKTMNGRQVIIRTLDIGADKQTAYFHIEPEENPAMGYRGIRICLDKRDIFKTQLRAIMRASAYGNIAIMYPMIISVLEVRQIKELVIEVKKELEKEGVPFGNPKQGIMIETPAAAVISDLLAREVDFFSIGTNDLTQYTLAIDRQNTKLDTLYDAKHEAVLRLTQLVVENAHKAGIVVGICGELGADVSLTERFLQIGVDELSVSPAMVLPVRKAIRESKV